MGSRDTRHSLLPPRGLTLAALVLGVSWTVAGCSPVGDSDARAAPDAALESPDQVSPSADTDPRPANPGDWPSRDDSIPGTPWTHQDWEIFRDALGAAETGHFDTLPLGEAIAAMGLHFVGTPYIPQTLEVPGAERLVVNLRALDCVTFVETVLALTRVHRAYGVEILDDPVASRTAYETALAQLRYREGRPAGYASRLHYFSDWIGEGVRQGRLRDVTGELGGVEDPEPADFMSRHPGAYRQLADPDVLSQIVAVEAELRAQGPRRYLPEDRIPETVGDGSTGQTASRIRTGDVIAATSTVPGLDVAHTGLAIWRDGVLHLLHAPLVGSTVVLSERPLARRIREISGQDGIMVARPLEPWFSQGG